MEVETVIQLLEGYSIAVTFILIYFWMAAGPWMAAYGKAKLTGGKVFIEYDRTKEYAPFCAKLISDLRSAIKLPGERGILGVRRESAGHSNKTQTFLFSSEFEYTISPQEANGTRWMSIDETDPDQLTYGYVFNEKFNKITPEEYKDGKYPNAKVWVRYPDSTITPEEFVKYQSINADPLLTEGYAQHKENALREKMQNPIGVMLAQHGYLIIAIIVVGGLAYNWMSNNNVAISSQQEVQACKQTIIDLYNTGVCKGGNIATNLYNATINTGAAMTK